MEGTKFKAFEVSTTFHQVDSEEKLLERVL